MTSTLYSSWRDDLLLNRDARTDAARAEFARRTMRGELVRVSTGSYFPRDRWDHFDDREKYLLRACIVSARADDPMIFSHATAAAIWGLPWVGSWPDSVDIIRSERSRGHYAAGLRRHRSRDTPQITNIDGLAVTSLGRTVCDLLRQPGLLRAVVVGDAALSGRARLHDGSPGRVGLDELHTELMLSDFAATRARNALDFLDGRSESPGESISRVTMSRAGLQAPDLQRRFGSWTVDFWWPAAEVIGEFDGAVKYLDPAMQGEHTAREVVYREKLREDALRRQSRGFARWGYAEAMSPLLLRTRLMQVGVPSVRRARFAASSAI